MFQLVMDEFCNFFPSGCDEGNLWAETRLAQNGKTLSFSRARLDHRPLLLLPSKVHEKEFISTAYFIF
jgi:hypothetical protein